MSFFKKTPARPTMAEPEPAARRITTTAGDRLSTIVEGQSFAATERPSRPERGGFAALYEGDEDAEKLNRLRAARVGIRDNKHVAKRGGWKRLALIALLFVLLVIALVLGIVFGLRTRNSNRDNNNDSSNSGSQSPSATASSAPPAPTATDASGRPENFPVGSYSMATYLDTINAACTENPATWRCYPDTTYNDNSEQSLTVYNWAISKDGDNFTISSTDNPFTLNFQDQTLKLVDQGKDTERYTFMMNMNKEVSPTSDISGHNAASTCWFNQTTFTAALYTNIKREWPSDDKPLGASFPLWPYRIRVEQSIAGGQNVPTCYENSNGQNGAQITNGLAPQDSSTLCSCLYRNWLTPNPSDSTS